MKSLVNTINESVKLDTIVTFDLKNDVYNVLSELAYEYHNKNKDKLFDKDKMETALEFFMDKFYEEVDED